MATPPFKFGSTHLGFSSEDLQRLHEPWCSISKDELAEEGIETDTHLTIRYGIEDVNFTHLYNELLPTHKFPVHVFDIGMFETKDGDCIHWECVKTGPLLQLRETVEKIAECVAPNFPDYKPHITIAYVKKGLGPSIIERIREHLGINEDWVLRVQAESLIYGAKDGKRHVIPFSEDTPKALAESALIAMYQLNQIDEARSVRITVPSDKLSSWKAKQLSNNLEKVGGKYTQGKNTHIFKMPAKYGKTVFHKLWNTKGMKDEEVGPKVKYS